MSHVCTGKQEEEGRGIEEGRNKRRALYYLESRVLSPFVHCPQKKSLLAFREEKNQF